GVPSSSIRNKSQDKGDSKVLQRSIPGPIPSRQENDESNKDI
ncbi:20975_t:CDS:1, partial [Gigaspora rosea]